MSFFKKLKNSMQLFFHFSRSVCDLLRGYWRISALPAPRITIFGGSRVVLSDNYAQQAERLAKALVDSDISVVTGGGPGIMQAANCGAFLADKKTPKTIGISVQKLESIEGLNPCVQGVKLVVNEFFVRKWLLINYSCGFVIFPGGIGTMDELVELLMMMEFEQIPANPIILVGSEFWEVFFEWFYKTHKMGLISDLSANRIKIVDDVDEVAAILIKHCEKK